MGPRNVRIRELVDARKETRDRAGALEVLETATRVVVARGKRVLDFDMKKHPPEDELLKGALGPTGNLRAPTIITGRTVLVGFNEEMFEEFFG